MNRSNLQNILNNIFLVLRVIQNTFQDIYVLRERLYQITIKFLLFRKSDFEFFQQKRS